MRRIPIWIVIAIPVLAVVAIDLSRGSLPQPDQPDPCDISVTDMTGWSAERITATMQACADQTGYVEDPVDHTAGMIACRTRLRDTGRVLAGAGHLFRWTGTGLETMFSDRRAAGGDVITYIGDALEVQDSDGSWVTASYECDFDHRLGEILDVRTAEGRLR